MNKWHAFETASGLPITLAGWRSTINYRRATRTRTSKPSSCHGWFGDRVFPRAARNGIRLMSNCISLRMAIFRAFTVLTSFYEITAWTWTQFRRPVRRCSAVCLDNCCVSGALCPRARRELNFALGNFRDNRAPRLPSVSRRENSRTGTLYRKNSTSYISDYVVTSESDSWSERPS